MPIYILFLFKFRIRNRGETDSLLGLANSSEPTPEMKSEGMDSQHKKSVTIFYAFVYLFVGSQWVIQRQCLYNMYLSGVWMVSTSNSFKYESMIIGGFLQNLEPAHFILRECDQHFFYAFLYQSWVEFWYVLQSSSFWLPPFTWLGYFHDSFLVFTTLLPSTICIRAG